MKKREPWTKENDETLWSYIEQIENRNISIKEVAKQMDKPLSTVHQEYKNLGGTPLRDIGVEYALYNGDELLELGTLEDISKRVGVKAYSLRNYASERYIKSTPGGRRLVRVSK